MASSAALTTTHLAKLRELLAEWEAKQPPAKGFPPRSEESTARGDASQKDVLVCFRTRPSLPDEALTKFGTTGEAGAEPVEFCAGISVPSAEPGKFVAHVPGMKVRKLSSSHFIGN